jgi:RNA polymerase primary sigma factor
MDSVKTYLNEIARYPLLTAEQEIQLARQVEAGKGLEGKQYLSTQDSRVLKRARRAKDTIINANLRLVVFISKKYMHKLKGNNMEFMDIVQEGAFGLVRAVELYDSTKGYKFSTYAYWWIRQAITRGIDSKERLIRIPQHGIDIVCKAHKFKREYTQSNHKSPTLEIMARELDMDVKYLEAILRSDVSPRSMDAVVIEGGSCLGDMLEDVNSIDEQIAAVEADERRTMLEFAFSALDADEADVLKKRYGLAEDAQPATLASIAKQTGVSRERVRQRVQIAHTKMRLKLKAARFV